MYVGNIHFSITESDLQNVFEPFGELDFVQLQKEEGGRSRGYGFVQYVNLPKSPAPGAKRCCIGSETQTKLGKLWKR